MINQVIETPGRGKRVGLFSASAFLLCASAAGMLMLTGCGAQEEEEVVYVPPPPPPPEPPRVQTVAELKAELRIDPRVYLSEDQAPASTEARKSLLSFFDAFARGDDRALREMLSPLDQRELEVMVESGVWRKATEGITRIEIHTGSSPVGDEAALGIFELGMEYEPQLWYYRQEDDRFVFDAAPSPPDMMRRLSGADLVASWHDVLVEEEEIAARPDVPVDIPQRNIEEDTSRPGSPSTPSSPSSPSSPTAPTAPSAPASPIP